MKKSILWARVFIKVGVFAILIFTAPIDSVAGDRERIDQLEKDVQELKLRLSNLEKPVIAANGRQKSVISSEGAKSLANWRSLKKGMSYEDVRAILGEPIRINGGNLTSWSYPNYGDVTFYHDTVDSWREPR